MREINSGHDLALFYRGLPALIRGGQLFEELVTAVYESEGIVRPGGWVIDAGANKGLHTIPLAKLATSVLAFEPHPRFARNLRGVLAEEGLANVDLWENALGGTTAQRTFYMADVAGGNALSIYPGTEHISRAKKEVLCLKLDDALGLSSSDTEHDVCRINRLDFIKSDLDGHDFEALLGAKLTIETHRPIIAFEFGKERTAKAQGFTPEQFFGFFKEIDYKLYDICGVPFKESYWSWNVWTPWDLIAIPAQTKTDAIRVSLDNCLRRNNFEPLF